MKKIAICLMFIAGLLLAISSENKMVPATNAETIDLHNNLPLCNINPRIMESASNNTSSQPIKKEVYIIKTRILTKVIQQPPMRLIPSDLHELISVGKIEIDEKVQ